MKYPKQACLCMGVASILLNDDIEVGQCCKQFDYTGKQDVKIAMYNKGEEEELNDGSHNWVQNFRHADDLWEEEAVKKIKGIGQAKQQ